MLDWWVVILGDVLVFWIAYRVGWHRGFTACQKINAPLMKSIDELGKLLR